MRAEAVILTAENAETLFLRNENNFNIPLIKSNGTKPHLSLPCAVSSIKSCLHYKPWPSLGQAKVNVARSHHFGLEFCNSFCVFLCVVTLSAGCPLISPAVDTRCHENKAQARAESVYISTSLGQA